MLQGGGVWKGGFTFTSISKKVTGSKTLEAEELIPKKVDTVCIH